MALACFIDFRVHAVLRFVHGILIGPVVTVLRNGTRWDLEIPNGFRTWEEMGAAGDSSMAFTWESGEQARPLALECG